MNRSLSDLKTEFKLVEPPPGLSEEEGKVEVVVTNQGTKLYKGPLDVNLYASADSVLDFPLNEGDLAGTDELLGNLEQSEISLTPGQSKTLTLDFATDEFRAPTVVAPGAYHLIAEVDPNNTIAEKEENNNIANTFVSTPETDVILDWNSTFLNAIQANGIKFVEGDPEAVPALDPRDGAIVHTAMYDAVNAIERTHQPYFAHIDASEVECASSEAAAVGAAYQTLINLYPTEKDIFEAQRIRSLAEIPDGVAEETGFELGVEVANQILELRSDDGVFEAFTKPYTAEPTPGIWRPTPSNTTGEPGAEALLPGWGDVTPFAISSVEDILHSTGIDGPPSLDSEQYARELEEVRSLGGLEDTALTEVTRTPEQTEIAKFWALDRFDTYQTTGQYNVIAQEVALEQGNSLAENARLFALLNTALADAGAVAFDAKYTYNQWRPITGIREADTDGNPDTVQDSDWNPLLDNPPFPDYIAAHTTSAGAASQVLTSFFERDDISFDVHSQELPGTSRSLNSFSEIAEEVGQSRLYAGVHLRSSNEEGIMAGKAVGNSVFDNILRPADGLEQLANETVESSDFIV